jgi:hypothetical protein
MTDRAEAGMMLRPRRPVSCSSNTTRSRHSIRARWRRQTRRRRPGLPNMSKSDYENSGLIVWIFADFSGWPASGNLGRLPTQATLLPRIDRGRTDQRR